MKDYTILINFRSSNALEADLILGDLQEPFLDVLRDYPLSEYGTMHITRGNRVDAMVIAESESISNEADTISDAGRNDNPLPEGMPTL